MDQRKVINIAKLYSEKVRNFFNIGIYQIILFGSYAKNNATVDSDIDIAIVVEKFNDDYLSIITNLYKLTRNIDDRIEPLLFLKNNDKSGFLNQIQTEGKILFSNIWLQCLYSDCVISNNCLIIAYWSSVKIVYSKNIN